MERPLFPDDIVQKKANPKHIGIVERTYADVDSHEPSPQRHEPDPIIRDPDINPRAFSRFMRDGVPPKGTILARWQHTTSAQLLPESKLKLLDRSLLIGDVVKRGANDATTGVVVNTFTKCTLQPICDLTLSNRRELKGLLPPTNAADADIRVSRNGKPPQLVDIPACELQCVESPSEADLVIYGDWIGRVEVVRTAITLKLTDGCVVEIVDELAEHVDGAIDVFFVGDVASTKKGRLRTGRWIYGQYNPNTAPIGTVVDSRVVTAEVTWLQNRIGSQSAHEPPQVLERDELESSLFHVYDRTRRPAGNSSGEYQNISNSEIDARLGLRVRFKDLVGASVKYDGSNSHGKLSRLDRRDTTGYDLNVFDIVNFRTDVTIQWQDLTITHERSIDLIPEHAFEDEHVAWPGEIAHTADLSPTYYDPNLLQPSKVGVIQTVDSQNRMARVRWSDGLVQYSVDDGVKILVSRIVATAAGEAEEITLYDIETPGELNVRRGDIVLIAPAARDVRPTPVTTPTRDWLGEIVDTRLDGTLVVRLGAASQVRDVTLKREEVIVAVRSDATDALDNQWDDELEQELADEEDEEDEDDARPPLINDRGEIIYPGEYEYIDDDMDSEAEEDSDDEDDEARATYEDENGMKLDEEDLEGWESDDDEDEDMPDAPQQTPPTSLDVTPPVTSKQYNDAPTAPSADEASTSSAPDQYLILDADVPTSHHYNATPATSSPQQLKRLNKEHKILRTAGSLPAGVYVRTYASRLDLLRVLFVGPTDTPYAHCPFVIDFHLGEDFPSGPPKAFFHSWTTEAGLGGTGRVNPNLYEDGKICLSLLGTWDGERSEGWNAGKSTVLQVVVSILGLVLVREPYFNEAGYEPLAGLESSRRPSAVYSERVYLRSKTFLLAALRGVPGTEGVEDVLGWLYRVAEGEGLWRRVVGEVEGVLARSEGMGEGRETDGMEVMSKGACIPLRRVLERLKEV